MKFKLNWCEGLKQYSVLSERDGKYRLLFAEEENTLINFSTTPPEELKNSSQVVLYLLSEMAARLYLVSTHTDRLAGKLEDEIRDRKWRKNKQATIYYRKIRHVPQQVTESRINLLFEGSKLSLRNLYCNETEFDLIYVKLADNIISHTLDMFSEENPLEDLKEWKL